jgi:hypothetical protein
MINQPVLHVDRVQHDVTPVEHRFARRSARYLADEGLTPAQIRDALMQQLELPAPVAESIVFQLVTGASSHLSLTAA